MSSAVLGVTNLLLAGIRDVSILLKEGADVECLSTPEIAVNRPVKSQLEGATIE